MRNTILFLFTCLLCLGCGSNHYGFSETAWNNLHETEREAIEAEALDHKLTMQEAQREEQFVNKPHNVYLGSRSNEYCPGCGIY